MKIIPHLIIVFLFLSCPIANCQILSSKSGSAKLQGIAPQETIVAESQTLEVKLDKQSMKINARQYLNQFEFSQGAMQKKDAEEKYWEIKKYPLASFRGDLIGVVDFKKQGKVMANVRGTFSLHGVEKEMKIPVEIEIDGNKIKMKSTFSVFLSDFNIKIPKLVSLKVSEEFTCSLSVDFTNP